MMAVLIKLRRDNAMTPVGSSHSKGTTMFQFDNAWLAKHEEDVIEPLLPIIDPHHPL